MQTRFVSALLCPASALSLLAEALTTALGYSRVRLPENSSSLIKRNRRPDFRRIFNGKKPQDMCVNISQYEEVKSADQPVVKWSTIILPARVFSTTYAGF